MSASRESFFVTQFHRPRFNFDPENLEYVNAFAETLILLGLFAEIRTLPVNSEIKNAFAETLILLGLFAEIRTLPVNSEIKNAFAETLILFVQSPAGTAR